MSADKPFTKENPDSRLKEPVEESSIKGMAQKFRRRLY